MASLVLFIFASIGLTFIIVEGKILDEPRKWLKTKLSPKVYYLFECYQCSGVWCGGFCGYILLGHSWQIILASAFAGSFLAYAAAYVLTYLEANSTITK